MGIDESEVSRLLRGDVPNDDPEWGEVSTFLDSVETAYPTVPTTAVEDRHLAAIAHETRLVHSELRRPRQSAVKRLFHGSHRVLAGSIGAFLIALTAGIGVASALGINPLGQLFAPHPAASSVGPQAPSPKVSSAVSADSNNGTGPGTTSPRFVPGSVPATGLPTPTGLAPPGIGSPSSDAAAKASAKAQKDAEKAAEKAKKDAEKAAEKAKKEAEKKKAKATPTPKPPPPPHGPGKGKGPR
jgi:hypothetical protein